MGIKYYKEPKLKKPILIAGWPGIGNIGIIAVDSLMGILKAEEFGEIESWEFFFPKEILIRDGELKRLEFPVNKFYYRRLPKGDVIFFIGEEQSMEIGKRYAEGERAEEIANLILLDVAEKFGCQRIYTSGAAVARIHHKERSRVVIAANESRLIKEMEGYPNTIPLSERERRSTLVGLSGILLGVAKNRGLEGICLMGEIPDYLAGSPWPYPKGSKSIIEVLTEILEIKIDLPQLDEIAEKVEEEIIKFFRGYQEFSQRMMPPEIPPEIRESHNKILDWIINYQPAGPGPITEKDKEKIMKDIEEFFKKGGKDGGRP